MDNSSLPDPLKKPKPYADPAEADLRASDADRERVAEALREAYAEGRLTAEEHSERVDSVYAAKTLGELVPLTVDLPSHAATHAAAAGTASVPRPAGQQDRSALPSRTEPETMVAVFGGAQRKGRFRAGRSLKALAVFGGVEIDLTEAVFDAPELVIHCTAVFGGVEIRVPEHVTLRGGGAGIFGGFDVKQQEGTDPHGPVVTIKGSAVFGGVEAKLRRPNKLAAKAREAARRFLDE
ncbi:DUF1707 SHOCT-like domain-containing protein [Streptacidiphilus cavernicola]|uniref:DUF1707 domain-containing protein n=1 Tax=Streptacidiphilus cavernicola TaxID=3342716 RepID=A0ABV6VUL5_9ACTN